MMAKTKRKLTAEQKAAIKNREAITDAVCDYMHEHHRDMAIDSVLCSPLDSILMASAIAAKSGRTTNAFAKQVQITMNRIAQDYPEEVAAWRDILHTAIASRKRGDLKKDRY